MEISREESFPQIDLVIKREGNKAESLIQILHGVQEMLGYLPMLRILSRSLKIRCISRKGK